MIFDRVDAQADDLAIAFFELGFQSGQVAKFGRTYWREVFRVLEQHGPLVTNPLMEIDGPFRGVGRKIRCLGIDS